MINPGVVLLITLAIILTIIVVILLVWAIVSYYNFERSGGTGTTGNFPCSDNINISSLIQITDATPVCVQNGVAGSLYYIGQTNLQYDYVVAPWGTSPLDVCVGFCTGYTGGQCSGPQYAGASAQQNFDKCMSQLSSTGCAPPIPIAANGTILYYAFTPTCNICDNCGITGFALSENSSLSIRTPQSMIHHYPIKQSPPIKQSQAKKSCGLRSPCRLTLFTKR